MTNKKVSIIVPVWNHFEDVTLPFIDEIFKTKDVDFELIFVDNGSVDGTSEKLKKIFKSDDRVKIVTLPENHGWSGGNNQGYKVAIGEIIVFLNNDVEIDDPFWLRKMIDELEESPNTILGAEEVTDQPLAEYNGKHINYLNGWCLVVPRKFLEKYGVFHPAMEDNVTPLLEDVEFIVRARFYGWKTKVVEAGIRHLGFRTTFDQVDMWEVKDRGLQTFHRLCEKMEQSKSPEDYMRKEFE